MILFAGHLCVGPRGGEGKADSRKQKAVNCRGGEGRNRKAVTLAKAGIQ